MLILTVSGYGVFRLRRNIKDIAWDSENFDTQIKAEIVDAMKNLLCRLIDTLVALICVPLILMVGPWRLPGLRRKIASVKQKNENNTVYFYTPEFIHTVL